MGGQVTVDTFFVPPFRSPYANPAISFGPGPDLGWSLVASVLLGAHLWKGATVVAAPYLARAYFHQDVDLGGAPASNEEEPQPEGGFMPTGNASLGRSRPPRRIEITIGKFGSNDFLDVAEASSDPRHKFMNWALMPTAPNGSVFGGNLSTSGACMVEGQYGWGASPAEGSVRLLAYVNRGNLGSYSDALSIAASGPPGALPDVDATATPGAVKYGFAALVQQELGLLDLFLRVGWNDGRTQTFCFTSIDRSISVGAQLDGAAWGRHGDFAGAGVAVSGLSSSHAAYLAAGGRGAEFQLGDGALAYGWEVASEICYSLQPVQYLQVTAGLQAIFNPGMDAARGPAFLGGIRVHAHF